MATPYQTPDPLPDRSYQVVGAAVAAAVVSTVAVGLRCCSRALAKASKSDSTHPEPFWTAEDLEYLHLSPVSTDFHGPCFWWDDWVLIISLPFTWMVIGLTLGWTSVGLGKHIWSPGIKPVLGFKLLFASELLYDTNITFIRLSVVLFYHRIFGKDRWFRIALRATVGLLVAWWIANNALATFQCSPIARQWDRSIPGHCYSLYGTFMGVTIPNVVIDLLILLLPLPMLWRLQIYLKKKIALIANFVLGYCVIIVTIFRLLSIIRIPTGGSDDATWNSTTPAILFMVEPAVATLSICLPSIWSLAVYSFKNFPTASFRSAWSKRSSTLVHNMSRKNGNTTSTDNGAPAPYSKPTFTYPDSLSSTPTEKRVFVDFEGRVSPLSEHSLDVAGEPPEIRRSPLTKSMGLEERVKGIYTRAAFDRRSIGEIHQHLDSGGDVEMARPPLRRNPLPVPPKY